MDPPLFLAVLPPICSHVFFVALLFQVAEIEAAEKEKMRNKCKKIIDHGVNVFINRQLIYNFPEQVRRMLVSVPLSLCGYMDHALCPCVHACAYDGSLRKGIIPSALSVGMKQLRIFFSVGPDCVATCCTLESEDNARLLALGLWQLICSLVSRETEMMRF